MSNSYIIQSREKVATAHERLFKYFNGKVLNTEKNISNRKVKIASAEEESNLKL